MSTKSRMNLRLQNTAHAPRTHSCTHALTHSRTHALTELNEMKNLLCLPPHDQLELLLEDGHHNPGEGVGDGLVARVLGSGEGPLSAEDCTDDRQHGIVAGRGSVVLGKCEDVLELCNQYGGSGSVYKETHLLV